MSKPLSPKAYLVNTTNNMRKSSRYSKKEVKHEPLKVANPFGYLDEDEDNTPSTEQVETTKLAPEPELVPEREIQIKTKLEDSDEFMIQTSNKKSKSHTKKQNIAGTMEDDLTHKLADIVKANIRIACHKEKDNDNTSKFSQDAQEVEQEPEQDLVPVSMKDTGMQLKFNTSYRIWVHKETDSWGIHTFDKNFFTLDSISSFLVFFGNFHKFNLNDYSFHMIKNREDASEPTGEQMVNGSMCSLRIEAIYGIDLIKQIAVLLVNDCLLPDMSIINEISINKIINWILIKIWVTDKTIDVSKLIPSSITNAYPSLGIKSKSDVAFPLY